MNQQIISEHFKEHPMHQDYWFSNFGRVVSTKNNGLKILSGTIVGQSKYIGVAVQGKKKIYVHRVVCELFNGPPQKNQQCRHLDGNNKNNIAKNLAWGTAKENNQDKLRHGTSPKGEKNPMAKLNHKIINEMIKTREETKFSYKKLAKLFNVSTMTAFRAVNKRSWV